MHRPRQPRSPPAGARTRMSRQLRKKLRATGPEVPVRPLEKGFNPLSPPLGPIERLRVEKHNMSVEAEDIGVPSVPTIHNEKLQWTWKKLSQQKVLSAAVNKEPI